MARCQCHFFLCQIYTSLDEKRTKMESKIFPSSPSADRHWAKNKPGKAFVGCERGNTKRAGKSKERETKPKRRNTVCFSLMLFFPLVFPVVCVFIINFSLFSGFVSPPF